MNTSLIKIASFFGESEIEDTNSFIIELKEILLDLIKIKKVSTFFICGSGHFDNLCYDIISEFKKEYPNINLILRTENYDNFEPLPIKMDYWYTKIYPEKCEIVDISDYIVFCIRKKESGAYKIYKHALKYKKNIINL